MKTHHDTAEQIIKILEQAERGVQTVGAVCREHGVAEAPFYRWRQTYGGMRLAETHRLKELARKMVGSSAYSPSECAKLTHARRYWQKKLTVAARREIVDDLVDYGCSVLRACERAQLHRATCHYQQRLPSKDELLSELTSRAQRSPAMGTGALGPYASVRELSTRSVCIGYGKRPSATSSE